MLMAFIIIPCETFAGIAVDDTRKSITDTFRDLAFNHRPYIVLVGPVEVYILSWRRVEILDNAPDSIKLIFYSLPIHPFVILTLIR